jgi:hypothetical protein
MFTSPLSPEQWAEARRLRAEGATFVAIAAQIGLQPATVARRAGREGWPRPAAAPTTGSADPARRRPKARPDPNDTAARRRGLAARLYKVMDLMLELMELRLERQLEQARQAEGEIPPGDAEKDMRQLAATMKSIEQATELDPDRQRDADGGAKSSDAAQRASEADALRREIAERIEKLIPPS